MINNSKLNSYQIAQTQNKLFFKDFMLLISKFSALVLITISLIACEKGIEPKNELEPTGFSGTVTFVGEWPPEVKRAFVVVFKDPLLASTDFTITNLKYLSLEIPLGAQSYHFSSLDSSFIPTNPGPFLPGRYAYVAVAYQTTDQLSLARKDWYVVGVYYAFGNTTKPATMVVTENIFLTDINITCDFDNLPPQPPGGS